MQIILLTNTIHYFTVTINICLEFKKNYTEKSMKKNIFRTLEKFKYVVSKHYFYL